MNEKLAKGTHIKTILNGEVVVDRWLAEGGQGNVYVVKYNGEEKALKWYKSSGMGENKDAFYDNLKNNVVKGAPNPAFLWPLDITEWRDGVFGYVMNLRPEGYYEVSDFMLTHVRFKSYHVMVDAALQIVSAYRILHNKGYSYQDLNDGNFFIDPNNGKVLICDNDNVAPDGTETGIIGKPRYMAPEIVMRREMPNSLSDRFSMSVILFILFTLNHPLEGKRSLVPAMTPKHQEALYGSKALFIMDQSDRDNAPDPAIHRNVLMVWDFLPDYMRRLFSRAFGQEALHEPNTRPKEVEWIKCLVRFQSDIVPCQCGNEVFIQQGKPCVCEKCQSRVDIPFCLKLQDYSMPVTAGNKLYRCQLGPCNVNEALNPIGEVVSKGGAYGLRNCSGMIWNVTTPSGKSKRVMAEEGIPMKDGIKFTVDTGTIAMGQIEIIANNQ